MKYQTADLPLEGVTLEGVLKNNVLKAAADNGVWGEITTLSPLQYRIQLSRSGTTVSVKGSAAATVELSCSRCLEGYDFYLTSEFRFSLVPEVHEAIAYEKELQPEELETEFYDGKTIDVGKIVLNSVVLALPIKPLCREDCKGLCPRCGINQNTASCTCSTDEPVDTRLMALKDFFSK